MTTALSGTAVQGTVAYLIGTATINSTFVDIPIIFQSKWKRQDCNTAFHEVTNVSDVILPQFHYSNVLTFAPLRDDTADGGFYIYTVTVRAVSSSQVVPVSANHSITLKVSQYPKLNISNEILTSECRPLEGITLSGSITLLHNTYQNRNITFTWKRNGNIEEVKRSTKLERGSLVIKSLTEVKLDTYVLDVCLTIPLSGLRNHCSRSIYEITTTGKLLNTAMLIFTRLALIYNFI